MNFAGRELRVVAQRAVRRRLHTHLFVNNGNVNGVSQTGDYLVSSFDNSGDLFSISIQYKF